MEPNWSKPWCYWIDESQEPPNENKPGYIPSAVFEDDPGHYPMVGRGRHSAPWYWGNTLEKAQAACDKMNADMDISAEEAHRIVNTSIAAQIRGGRTPQQKWTGKGGFAQS